jgi:hypothetical protein
MYAHGVHRVLDFPGALPARDWLRGRLRFQSHEEEGCMIGWLVSTTDRWIEQTRAGQTLAVQALA